MAIIQRVKVSMDAVASLSLNQETQFHLVASSDERRNQEHLQKYNINDVSRYIHGDNGSRLSQLQILRKTAAKGLRDIDVARGCSGCRADKKIF